MSCRENLYGLDVEYSILSRASSLSTTCSLSILLALALLFLPVGPLDQTGLFHPVKNQKVSEKNMRRKPSFFKRGNILPDPLSSLESVKIVNTT